MNKKIKRIACKFKKEQLKNEVDADKIIDYLQKNGYTVVFYSNGKNDELLMYLGVHDYSKTVTAFTFCGSNGNNYVFISDDRSVEDKLYSLLHEAGHIFLGHLQGNASIKNDRMSEMEAEAFAYSVLNYKNKDICCPVVGGLIIVLALLCYCVAHNIISTKSEFVEPPAHIQQTVSQTDVVYVTPSGNKYHKNNCVYTKDKDCIGLLRADAEKNYSPCLACKP